MTLKLANSWILMTAMFLPIAMVDAMDIERPWQATPSVSVWGPQSQGFQLSARLEKARVIYGEPVRLQLKMRNATNEVLLLAVSSPEKDFRVSVRNENGEETPLTEYGEKLLSTAGDYFSRFAVKVNPWEELSFSYPIAKVYEMTPSKTYHITARRLVFRQDGKGIAEVVSNIFSATLSD